jgi:hypothetical protein
MCCAVVGAEKKKRTPALLLFLRKGFCYNGLCSNTKETYQDEDVQTLFQNPSRGPERC